MKSRFQRIFSKVNIFILIWPIFLWFGLYMAFYMTDENIATFIVHHFFEFYFTFFIINVFGAGLVMDGTREETMENIDIDWENKKFRNKKHNPWLWLSRK